MSFVSARVTAIMSYAMVTLAAMGLRLVDVAHDGNCVFSALVKLLSAHGKLPAECASMSHTQCVQYLRNFVADLLEAKRDQYLEEGRVTTKELDKKTK